MNASCGVSTASDWKKGWPLRSGGYANLCDKCGLVHNLIFYFAKYLGDALNFMDVGFLRLMSDSVLCNSLKRGTS